MNVISLPMTSEWNPDFPIEQLAEVRHRVLAILPRDARGVLPLSLTIDLEVENVLRDLDPALVRTVLRDVILESDYLQHLLTDDLRYALNGEAVGRIARHQREFARGVLELRGVPGRR